MRKSLAITLTCAAVLAAGCGSDDSSSPEVSDQDAQAVSAIVALGDEVQAGLESMDARKVCSLMDPAGKKKTFKNEAGCVKRLNATFNQGGKAPEYSFSEVTVTGDTAMAKNEAGTGNVYFEKVGDQWYIDINPPVGDSSSQG